MARIRVGAVAAVLGLALGIGGAVWATIPGAGASRLGQGHYRIDIAPGVFSTIPDLVVMPIGKAYVSGATVSGLGGGAWRLEYFLVGIDSNALQDDLHRHAVQPLRA